MKHVLISATVLSFVLVGAAAADPGKGKGQGHGKRGHDAAVSGAWTPPGLAKKRYGMPPGQAKKMWSQGERLPNHYYTQQRYYVADPSRYNLPPAPYGSRWVLVGDNYYQTRTDSGIVSQIVSALLR